MLSFLESLFTPLDKRSCIYFLSLSILFFILFVGVLVRLLYNVLFNYKSITGRDTRFMIAILVDMLLAYFVNRLFYSICIRSLH